MIAKLYATVLVVAVCATFAGLAAAFPYGDVEAPQPSYDHHQHVQAAPEHGDDHEHAPRSYHFQYAVHDPTTGDVKSQNEVSDGHGTVKGTYSLLEADGSTRVVEYTADDEHGFRAEVKKIQPHKEHKEAAAAAAAPAAPAAEPAYKFDYPEHLHEDAEHVHYYPGETFTPTY